MFRNKGIKTAVLFILVAALTGCSGTNISIGSSATPTGSNTLRVGVRDNINGFGYYNEALGKYSGFEIDIAEELAERLGYSAVSYTTVTPGNRSSALMNGEVDCCVACHTITEDREENVDFSPAYFEDGTYLVVQDSSLITDVWGLEGYTIGMINGSNSATELIEALAEIGFLDPDSYEESEDGLERWYGETHFVKMGTYQELDDALEAGDIDALCTDGSIAKPYLGEERYFLNFEIATQDYGVSTKKDSELSGPVAETIQEMLDDGTIDEFAEKWDVGER